MRADDVGSPRMTLIIEPGRFAVARLGASEGWPDWALGETPVALVRTRDEVSVVCREDAVPVEVRAERGWRMLAVVGPIDFGLTGVIAGLTAPLARAAIGVFVVSTYDTDWMLVRAADLDAAVAALVGAGHAVR